MYTCYGTLLTRMFSGLMSRCTIDREWRYLRAEARLYTMPLASRSVYLVADDIASNRSPPWNHHQLGSNTILKCLYDVGAMDQWRGWGWGLGADEVEMG